ncbi:MAG: hypothetical protein N2Z22_10185, partial [Turneriella sp.]|nr:hypothetical protein [Turneriella sp.]
MIITRQMSRLAMRITAVLQRAGYGTAILESPDHGDHHGGGIAALVLPGVRGTELKSQVSQLHEKLGERIPIIALC